VIKETLAEEDMDEDDAGGEAVEEELDLDDASPVP
jgi:hypothetical protein